MEERKLPNPTLIIVLGVVGILCCCFAGIGLIPAAIALNLSRKAEEVIAENPELYIDKQSTVKAGKIIAIAAIAANLYILVRMAFDIYSMGWDAYKMQFEEAWEQAKRQAEATQ
ncbi:CCC motif membrane protein [Robertkochia flava]|uniref:CCC motif membrane protein n=1 Tax=Robertkochia flava TaxID=3447986 RepID=UPI001CCC675E|nr:CCC motif membrane protein [Robertkochia marina]